MRDAGRTRGRTVPAGCWARSFPKSCLCNFDDALSIPATILAPPLPTASPYKRVYIRNISPSPRPALSSSYDGEGKSFRGKWMKLNFISSFHFSPRIFFNKNKCKNIGDWKILLSFLKYFLNKNLLTRISKFQPWLQSSQFLRFNF